MITLFHRPSAVRTTTWHKEAVARDLRYPTSPCARFGHSYTRLTPTTWICPTCKEKV